MGQRQEQQQHEPLTIEQGFNIAYNLSHVAFWMVAPFLRSGFGPRAATMRTLIAIIATMVCAATYGSTLLTFYSWAWIGMFAWRRMTPGEGVPSVYHGNPAITGLFARDRWLAMMAEIPLVFLVGAALTRHDAAAGRFFTWVSLGLAVKYWIEWQYRERIKDAIRDEILIMDERMTDMHEG